MTDSKDRALEIHELTFDARDPHALAAFWGALLDREIRPGDMPQHDSVLVMPTAGQLGLLFLRVPEGKTAKNRIHFDLWPTSTKRDEQVERAIDLGAVVFAHTQPPQLDHPSSGPSLPRPRSRDEWTPHRRGSSLKDVMARVPVVGEAQDSLPVVGIPATRLVSGPRGHNALQPDLE
jgi:Glyoxalase-like domain